MKKQSQQGGFLSKNLTRCRPKKNNSRKTAVWQRFVESGKLKPEKAEYLRKQSRGCKAFEIMSLSMEEILQSAEV